MSLSPAVRTVCLLLALGACGETRPSLDSDAARLGYALGQSIGHDLAEQGMTVDVAAVQRGVADGIANAEPSVPREQMAARLGALKREIVLDHPEEAGVNRPGRAEEAPFLAANGAREGVQTLPSGVQVEILEPGSGPSPTLEDTVRIRYRSSVPSGQIFHDNLEGDPETHAMSDLVEGLQEGLTHVEAGGKAYIVIPSHLGFRNFKMGPLARRALAYEIELVEIAKEIQ